MSIKYEHGNIAISQWAPIQLAINYFIMSYIKNQTQIKEKSIDTPVLYTVVLLSPSVYYTHDFRPKNREW
jgi:hypothetical protein